MSWERWYCAASSCSSGLGCVFVGVKFMISDLVGKVSIWVSLPFIATVVTVSILASLWKTRGQGREALPGSQGVPEEAREDLVREKR